MKLQQLIINPGERLLIKDINWQMFENILDDLGESRASKITYNQGILEIMTPLLEHEFDKCLISDLVKAILEELNIEFLNAGSTTLKNQIMNKGIEPDDCLYIQNETAVRGKKRIDLTIDPPPDLAIEIDITSRTELEIYQVLKVPEVWIYNKNKLQIYLLQNGKYQESNHSAIFPKFPLIDIIPQQIERSQKDGRNSTMRAFRNWIRSIINQD
jgi:Uma2 family endonuclease